MTTYREAIRRRWSYDTAARAYNVGTMSADDFRRFCRLWYWAGYPKTCPEVVRWYDERGRVSYRARANRASRVVAAIAGHALRVDSAGYLVPEYRT